ARPAFVEKIEIPLPYPEDLEKSLKEQKRIAAILDKADGIRRKRKQTIQLADEFLLSFFLETFGDPVTNPKGWEIKKIEDVALKVTDGVHFKPNYIETGVPFISVKDITTGKLSFENTKFISLEDHENYIRRCNPEYMDILYTKVGATYGRPAIVDVKKDFSLYVSVCLIKPDHKKINAMFLTEVLATSALKRQADRSIKGAGVPDLHLIEIKKFILPVPSMKVQNDYVKKTRSVHKKIETYKESLRKIDDLFKSLSQKAFNGEL
ncbi:MAG: restriction endonuclease subunit S, partial [Cycloclasticus sp.]